MVQIGRNDQCPCGSGKKYKKCCGKSVVVSIEQILSQEAFELQMALVDFAWTEFNDDLTELVAEHMPVGELPNAVQEVLTFTLANWVIFTKPIDHDGRIIDHFIVQANKRVKRQRLLEIVRNWDQGRPSVSRLVEKNQDLMVIEDLFTKEHTQVKLMDPEQIAEEIEKNSLIIGILLPFTEVQSTFFTAYLNFSYDESTDAEERAMALYHRMGQARSYEEFVSDFYPELIDELLLEPAPMSLEEFNWNNDKERQVGELIEEQMAGTVSEAYLYTAWNMWYTFCKEAEPTIRKPELYAAAMHYLVLDTLFEEVTQKEVAELYGISATSLSQKYRELADSLKGKLLELKERALDFDDDDDLADFFENDESEDDEGSYLESLFQGPSHSGRLEIEKLTRELQREIESHDFKNLDDVNAFLQSKMGKPVLSPAESDEDRAQDLLFEAFGAKGKKRKTLIEKAKALDPNNPDVYNLLGEDAKKPEDRLALYKEGMERGEQALGKAFFKENRGYFWGLIETRPYMRAKENYARALLESGQIKNGLKHFEELLELNPNDNQGIRFELIELYLKLGQSNKVDALVKEYPDDFLGEDPFV